MLRPAGDPSWNNHSCDRRWLETPWWNAQSQHLRLVVEVPRAQLRLSRELLVETVLPAELHDLAGHRIGLLARGGHARSPNLIYRDLR